MAFPIREDKELLKMTNRMKKILAIGFAAVGIALLADTAMAAETAVWTTLNVSGGIADNVTLNVEEELRFGDISGPTLARQHTDLSLGFKVNDLMGVSAGYRNTSAGEHRPYVGIGYRLLSGDLNIDSASRIELSGFDTLSGRTALEVSTQVKGITLGVSDELRANTDGITGNRASIGVTKGVNDTVSVTAFYMLDSTGSDLSSTAHVLGLGLGVSL
jgi:hypothetical protein